MNTEELVLLPETPSLRLVLLQMDVAEKLVEISFSVNVFILLMCRKRKGKVTKLISG